LPSGCRKFGESEGIWGTVAHGRGTGKLVISVR
jgi:hypothetical protein